MDKPPVAFTSKKIFKKPALKLKRIVFNDDRLYRRTTGNRQLGLFIPFVRKIVSRCPEQRRVIPFSIWLSGSVAAESLAGLYFFHTYPLPVAQCPINVVYLRIKAKACSVWVVSSLKGTRGKQLFFLFFCLHGRIFEKEGEASGADFRPGIIEQLSAKMEDTEFVADCRESEKSFVRLRKISFGVAGLFCQGVHGYPNGGVGFSGGRKAQRRAAAIRSAAPTQSQRHPHKINRTNALSMVKEIACKLFIAKVVHSALQAMDKILKATTEIVRPFRKNERNKSKKKPPAMNYKPL